MGTAITIFAAAYLGLIAAAWKSRTLATETQDRHQTRVRLGRQAADNAALERLGALYQSIGALGKPVTSPSVDPNSFVGEVAEFQAALSDSRRLDRTYRRLVASCRALPISLGIMSLLAIPVFLRGASIWGSWDDSFSYGLYIAATVVVATTATAGGMIIVLEQRLPAQASKHVDEAAEGAP